MFVLILTCQSRSCLVGELAVHSWYPFLSCNTDKYFLKTILTEYKSSLCCSSTLSSVHDDSHYWKWKKLVVKEKGKKGEKGCISKLNTTQTLSFVFSQQTATEIPLEETNLNCNSPDWEQRARVHLRWLLKWALHVHTQSFIIITTCWLNGVIGCNPLNGHRHTTMWHCLKEQSFWPAVDLDFSL